MTQTLEETREGTSCYIEIRLEDGERIHARVSGDEAAARAELASFHAKLDSQSYVLVGDDTIVRSEDVRYVQLTGDDTSGGILDTVKDKLRGGSMSNYETQQRPAATARDSGREQGFTDQWVGYGNRPWAETKPFFLTSEFLAAAALIAGILVATGMNDNLDAPRGWLYAAIVGAAYIVSRGIAKAGTRDPNPDRSYGGGWSRQ
jgi:hypothetical protein